MAEGRDRCAQGEGGGPTALERTGSTGPNVLSVELPTPLSSDDAWVYEKNFNAAQII